MIDAKFYLTVVTVVLSITAIISTVVTYKTMTKIYSKKAELDISYEQMKILEKRISNFLIENNLKPGEPIQTIAKALNVVEGGVKDEISGRAWLSEPDSDGRMIVVFKKGLSKEEMIFDFAHECGHRINHDPTPATRPEGYNKSEVEQLADYVGAALLMPVDSVYNNLQSSNYINSSSRKRVKIIRKLCSIYGVSEMIALRRIKEVYLLKHSEMDAV